MQYLQRHSWHLWCVWVAPASCALAARPLANHQQGALCIGARLDDPGTGTACRIAFSGRVAAVVDQAAVARVVRVYKTKQREGCVERVLPDGTSAVVRDLLKKETDVAVFVGLTVRRCGDRCVCPPSPTATGAHRIW